VPLLRFQRKRRDRTGIEPAQRDRLTRLFAVAIRAVIDPGERRVDFRHQLALAIARTQLDPRHYFQQPERYLFDPTRTQLDGIGASGQIGRIDQGRLRYATGADIRSAGLELNDAGFQQQADRFTPFLWGEYHDNTPSDYLLNWSVNSDVFTVSNFEPTLLTYGIEAGTSMQFKNYWSLNYYTNLAHNIWDPVALRGGPALHVDPGVNMNATLQTDNRKALMLSLSPRYSHAFDSGAYNIGADLGATIQARSNIDIYLGPSFSHRRDPMQYVAEADDAGGTPHYILSGISQNTLSLTARVNWTFSPHLSLQVYAQPFIATGSYFDLKDVNNPHAENFQDRFTVIARDYASYAGPLVFDKPDFDVRQLRSTVVLRWEYRPGSTVFAIWSHGQTSTVDNGAFHPWDDVSALAHASQQNLVMVKANYWIGL